MGYHQTGRTKRINDRMDIVYYEKDCDLLSGTDTRLLIVGGAGSLYVNPEHTVQVKDGKDFPAMFLPLANAQGQELEDLRKRSDVKWTFISAAGDFRRSASASSAMRITRLQWLTKTKAATTSGRESAW